MKEEKPELYFSTDSEWREWLQTNHDQYPQGVYLIFYKLETEIPTMRWEEAVKVALCYGWIDSTVKGLGGGKRRQFFSPRNPKSTWSALNKRYIEQLEAEGLIAKSGMATVNLAKESGTWTAMDDVENLVVPPQLQDAFDLHPDAHSNFQNFAASYRKSYLAWLYQAKREATRKRRIEQIITHCKANEKSRN